jgi:hypothetical protein
VKTGQVCYPTAIERKEVLAMRFLKATLIVFLAASTVSIAACAPPNAGGGYDGAD